MKKIILSLLVLILPLCLPAFPTQVGSFYKQEIFKFDTVQKHWLNTDYLQYNWEAGKIQSIVQYYYDNQENTRPGFRDTFSYNSSGFNSAHTFENINLTGDGWEIIQNDYYTYDGKNRLIDEINTSFDTSKVRKIYSYQNDSDSLTTLLNLKWNNQTQAWDTIRITYSVRNGNNFITRDSSFGYDMTSHTYYNSTKNLYYYDGNDNIVKKETYSFGSAGDVLIYKYLFTYNSNRKISKYIYSYFNMGEEYLATTRTYKYWGTGSLKQMIDSGFSQGVYSSSSMYDYDYETRGDTMVITEIQTKYNLDKYNVSYKTVSYMFNTPEYVETIQAEPNEMTIFPNPVLSGEHINISPSIFIENNLEIKIYDTRGKVIYKYAQPAKSSDIFITCPSVPAGYYFIRAVSGGKVVGTGRIVIE